MDDQRTYSGPHLRAPLRIERVAPGLYRVWIGSTPAGELTGADAWRFRNWALGYTEARIDPDDVAFFGLVTEAS